MSELREYKTKINGLETTLMLSEEDARARGITGDGSEPQPVEDTSPYDPDTDVDGGDDADADAPDSGTSGASGASARGRKPVNKSRTADR